MKAFYFDQHTLPLPPGHRFPISKYGRLRAAIEASPQGITLVPAPAATEGELALAHTPDHIDAVLQGTMSPAQQREIGFDWSPAMAARACHSVGATVAAARAALLEGVAATLGGGTHHAAADKGSGYCVFNDVAVAARLMQAEWHRRARRAGVEAAQGLLQVLVIDLDVHQGNGTAAIFAEDDTVFTFSMHGERNFPFRKVDGDLDIGLPDGCTDDAYLALLDQGLATVWQRMAARPPGLAFFLAGADPHEGDRLGRLKLSLAALAERERRVFAALRERGIPVAVMMAGGYGHVVDTTVAVHEQTLRLSQQAWTAWSARPHPADHARPTPG